jgi:MFS family permease
MGAAAQTIQTRTAAQPGTMSALRYPHFRLYFIGQLISVSGTWMQTVAQGWLVFHLTQSELWLGVVACAAGLPALILSPFAGVLVDRFPRRNILILSQTVQMVLAFILALLTFANTVQVWHIVLLAFLLGVTNAIDAPARQAIIVDLVGKEDLPSGIALNAIMFNGSRIFGPVAAGLALTQVGPGWCFALNGASFLAVILMLFVIPAKPVPTNIQHVSPITRLREGLAFSRAHATIGPLLLLAAISSVFLTNVSTLLPAFADVVLHSPADGYAALTTAQGVGAVLAALLTAWAGTRLGRGRLVFAMMIFTPIATLLFAGTKTIPLAAFTAALVTFGLILGFVTVNTLIQTEVPDDFRGRVMSLYTLTFFGAAPFGALALGVLAGGLGEANQLALSGGPGTVAVAPVVRGIGTPEALGIYALIGGILSVYVILRAKQVRQLA